MAFLNQMVLNCCGDCENGHGTSVIGYNLNRKQNSSKKGTKYEMKEAIDDHTDLNFPVHGYSDQQTYLGRYKYVPVVESPGAAFIVRNEGLKAPITTALANSWPLAGILVAFIFLSACLFWIFVSDKGKWRCCIRSTVKGNYIFSTFFNTPREHHDLSSARVILYFSTWVFFSSLGLLVIITLLPQQAYAL